MPVCVLLVLVIAGAEGVAPAHAQVEEDGGLERRVLKTVYEARSPAFRVTMRAADASAWPAFVGAPVGAWADGWFRTGTYDTAYRLTLAEAGVLAGTLGLKYLTRRTRPYVRYPDIDTRTGDIARFDPYSFPSAHAALAFAIVTTMSLEHPRWYVIGPGYLWAGTVSLSRVWLGLHYPSDVLAGAAMGTAVSFVVYWVAPHTTPAF